MNLLISFIVAFIPAVVILYPFVRRHDDTASVLDESLPLAELERRWDAAIIGLRQAELELALGSVTEEDYQWLRGQYMTEAASVMKDMEIEEQHQEEMLALVEEDIQATRKLTRR